MRPLLLAFLAAASAQAQVAFDPMIGSDMVLQRDQPIVLRGTAKPGETVRVRLANDQGSAAAGADGKWEVRLRARPASAQTFYLFDEPTTGLHFGDVQKLFHALQRLRDAGHTVLVLEHNLEVIAACDWLIDLGRRARRGHRGGRHATAGRERIRVSHRTGPAAMAAREMRISNKTAHGHRYPSEP